MPTRTEDDQPEPMPEIKIGDHKLIRHSYDNVLTASARLLAFSVMDLSPIPGEVYDHQEILSIDDLISFSIHARRLIENTIKQENILSKLIVRTDSIKNQDYPLTRIINVIIHNSKLSVFRTVNEFKVAHRLASWESMVLEEIKYLKQPICVATSDRPTVYIFQIGDMIKSFQTSILEPIVELCSDQRLFLSSLYDL